MARKGPFAAALCVLLTFGADRTSLQADLRERSERVVHYTIEAELLPKEKVVRGQMDLVWRNPSSVPVDHIYVHLYLNAFKDRDSTYMRESEGAGKAGATWDKRHPGFIEIASMTREDGVELWTDENRAFVAPDDGNEKDRTLAHVKLPAPVQPGETLTLAVKWRSQLPRVVHRTGWAGDPDDPGNMFFMVAQWFPKIAVLRDGIWNAHQFHKNTEWFSDYGVYQVALTVPKGYVVGATGTRSVRRENGDGKITVVHRQEDVHDFTWTASPRFRVFERRWTFDSFCESSGAMGTRIRDLLDRTAKHLGVEPDTIKPQREVDVRILYQEDHEELVDRIWAATGASLACYGIWFGQYPYPVLTVVDPPAGGMAAGGMEYPTLFSIYSDRLAPTYATGLEGVTIHEFGHQFFYGLIATNEFEEAWLDEGFTSFTDARTFQEAYGASTATTRYRPLYLARRRPFEAPRVFGRIAKLLALERWLGKIPHPWSKPDSFTPVPGANPVWDYLRDMPALHFDADVTVPAPFGERNRVIGTKSQDAMVMHGWDFASRRDYGVNSYAKPTLFLYCMRGLMGEAAFDRAMYEYATTYRFRHPRTQDVLAMFRKHTPDEMRSLVEGFTLAMVTRAARVDAAIVDASQRKVEGGHEWTVRVQRRGGIPVPIDVVAVNDQGQTEIIGSWSQEGWGTTQTFRVVRKDKLQSVHLGPEWLRYLDSNTANNARRLGAQDRRPAAVLATRWSLYVEEIVRSFTGLNR